jgi:hypothetical protein
MYRISLQETFTEEEKAMVAWVINDESIYGILLLLLLFDGTGV